MEMMKDVVNRRRTNYADRLLQDLEDYVQRNGLTSTRDIYRSIEDIRRENNERLGR